MKELFEWNNKIYTNLKINQQISNSYLDNRQRRHKVWNKKDYTLKTPTIHKSDRMQY